MSRRMRRFSASVYEEKNSESRIFPWRDMRTMKFHPQAAEALDFSLESSKSVMVHGGVDWNRLE